jgi:hypothetical protein
MAAPIALVLVACSFQSPAPLDTPSGLYKTLNTAPYATPSFSERWAVLDDSEGNGMRVDHGVTCMKADRAASKTSLGIRVQEQAELTANQTASLFLNGWSASYASSDHHVTGVGAIIFNVRVDDGLLTWEAGGVLSDKKGDDAYELCYNYTVLYWPTNNNDFDIRSTHSDSTGKLLFLQDPAPTSAVRTITGSFTSTTSKLPRAALLSGFAISWRRSDHHLSQLGFDFGPQSLAQKTLGWTSTTAFKDNAKKRDYRAAEAATILSGRGISVTQPAEVFALENDMYVPKPNVLEFSPLPKTKCPGVQLSGPTSVIRNYMVSGLDLDYAMPMLSGFELAFDCDDQHVKNIGARIRDFWYQPPGDGALGTLHYQVETMLTDKDRIPEMNDRVAVKVLGINRLP